MEAVTQLSYSVDTLYFLVCGVLVMFMAPGFAMLEAGLVRAKNTSEILTKNVALFSIASLMYLICGYSIMYGDGAGWIPGFGTALFMTDNSVDDVLASGGDIYYSGASDFFFQVVFVATAMSIISGAVAERMKLFAFLAFAVVMTGFIYPVQGFWKWGGGALDEAGFLDFAGSGVVHMCGATAALAGVLLLGPRAGKYGSDGVINPIVGANMPLATLGVFILWFGWFGFNGGSELIVSNIEEANAVALIFVNTNTAAAAGLVAALLVAKLGFGKSDLTMALNGALAGLVAITAEPLTPSPAMALVIGAIGGVIVVLSTLISLLISWKYAEKSGSPVGEYAAILLAATLGAMILCGATDLISVFISLETLSVASYLLSGYLKQDARSSEAAGRPRRRAGRARAFPPRSGLN